MKSNIIKVAMITMFGIFANSSYESLSARTIVKDDRHSTTTVVSSRTPSKSTPTKKPSKVTHYSKPTKVTQSKVVYKSPTPTVRAVRHVPYSSTVRHKGINYYYHNGLYYRYTNGRYITVPAPWGIKIRTLPVGYRLLTILGRTYYYYQGTYYEKRYNNYEVVQAPQDIIVPTLPEEADLVIMNGKDYYVYDGYIYEIVITPNGKAFKSVGEFGR